MSGLHKNGSVRHASFLKLALLEHIFTRVIPVPPPAGLPGSGDFHPWSLTNFRFGQQLEVLLLLARLCEHMMAAAFSTKASKSLDAIKLIVLGAIAAAADWTLRQRAIDRTSIITSVMIGEEIEPKFQAVNADELAARALREPNENFSRGRPYGVASELFLKQSENFHISSPEVNVTRSGVYNYFCSQRAHEDHAVFGWEKDGAPPRQARHCDRVARSRLEQPPPMHDCFGLA